MTHSGNKPKYHHGDLRNAIIAAASEHIEQTQDWSFSLRTIASTVGVSHNAPYMHFTDKKSLLAAVGAQGFELLNDKMKNARGKKRGEARMIAIGRAYISFGIAHPGLYRLMFDPTFAGCTLEELDITSKRAYGTLMDTLSNLPWKTTTTEAEIAAKSFAAWSLVHGLTMLILDRRGLAQALDSTAPLPPFVDVALQDLIRGFITCG